METKSECDLFVLKIAWITPSLTYCMHSSLAEGIRLLASVAYCSIYFAADESARARPSDHHMTQQC